MLQILSFHSFKVLIEQQEHTYYLISKINYNIKKPNEKYLIFFAIYKSNLYISIHWFNYIKIEFTSFVNTFFIS